MSARRTLVRVMACVALLSLAGCAQLPAQPPVPLLGAYWQGRLALRVDNDPPQSFFAGFELEGSPQLGQLTFIGPLGQTLGRLRWQPEGAHWEERGGRSRQFASLAELAMAVTGADIPVAALFSWLRGESAEAAGWQADLSQLPEGRLQARRQQPEPAAELRLIIEP